MLKKTNFIDSNKGLAKNQVEFSLLLIELLKVLYCLLKYRLRNVLSLSDSKTKYI